MNLPSTHSRQNPFQRGDAVIVLYGGLYYGMDGHFLALRQDPDWADVEESGGQLRAHPVQWLRHKGAR